MKTIALAGLLTGLPLTGVCFERPADDSNSTPPPLVQQSRSLDFSLNTLRLAEADAWTDSRPQRTSSAPPTEPNLAIPDKADWAGLGQDTELFLLYQVAIVGVIYFLPESVSQWDEEAKGGNPFKKWDNNVSDLRRDTDKWGINYVMHPYFGGTYYVRARNRGFSRNGSFWYAAGMSTLYEYGIEAVFESPSVQDLIFTPVGGAVVGEYFMIGRQKILNHIAATGEQTAWDSLGLFLTDPIGVINRKVMESFGRQYGARLELQPILSPAFFNSRKTAAGDNQHQSTYGLLARLSW